MCCVQWLLLLTYIFKVVWAWVYNKTTKMHVKPKFTYLLTCHVHSTPTTILDGFFPYFYVCLRKAANIFDYDVEINELFGFAVRAGGILVNHWTTISSSVFLLQIQTLCAWAGHQCLMLMCCLLFSYSPSCSGSRPRINTQTQTNPCPINCVNSWYLIPKQH